MISLYDVLEASNGQLFGECATQIFADFSFDSRRPQESQLYVALRSERGDGNLSMREAVENGATGILCSSPPSFDTGDLSVILVKDTQAALMAWSRYMLKKLGSTVIAVTGSTGKSVTAEATRLVLGSRYKVHHRSGGVGRLSIPYSLAKLSPDHDFVILEFDVSQPGDMGAMLQSIQPDVGVVTQIGYRHIDTFETQERLATEHNRLIEQLPEHGLAVLNYDDELARAMVADTKASVLTVGVEHFGADLMAYNIVPSLTGTGFDLRQGQNRFVGRWTPLLGKQQIYNLLRALAIGLHFDVPVEDGLRAVRSLAPLPGRMNPLRGLNGATLIDDSYDADPQSMLSALEWLQAVKDDKSRAIFIMGEMEGLGSYGQRGHRMVGQVAARFADLLITEGTDAAFAARAALDEGMNPRNVYITYSAPDVVSRLKGSTSLTANDVILVTGGASSRMEWVVRSLLADQADAAQLPRQLGMHEITLSQPMYPSWVEVDLDALAGNVRGLKTLVGNDVTLCAVVKADAYGTGAVAVARTALMNGAEHLATASLNEALELRDAGIDAPILVMSYTPPLAARQAIRHNITLTVYDVELARAYDGVARESGGRLRVHVKVDTGMGRIGVLAASAVPFFRQMLGFPNLEIEGIYTHFSVADEDPDFTAEQVKLFKSVLKPLRASGFNFRYVHAANSAGTLASPDNHFNMVRCGLAMHGLSPSDTVRVPETFKPVLSWKTVIAQVKTLPPGHTVGYGNTYVTQGEERIAVIPVGYSDGFRRAPQNWGRVLVHGQYAPLVGRVSMEKSAINVSHIPDVSIGDEVVLLGSQGEETITADDIARQIGTISYEVLCSVLPRIPRR